MRSDLATLRAAAEPYKSFPVAVAALVHAAFDRGAMEVKAIFEESDVSLDLWIFAKDVLLSHADMSKIIDLRAASTSPFPDNIGLAFIHHVRELMVYGGHRCMSIELEAVTESPEDHYIPDEQTWAIGFLGLGQGEGVNPKQDRSAKRLVRELPRHLSPREAYRTIVIDEQGTEHKLVKSLPSTIIDGLRVSWPERLVGFGREGLTLKFGAVRVSMRSFVQPLILGPAERKQLMLLTNPWLQGIVEIEVADSQVAGIMIPPRPGDNLSNFIIPSGHAERLARAILQIVPAVALREMNKIVNADLQDFCNDQGELKLSDHTYEVKCADESHLWRVEHVALGDMWTSQTVPTKHGVWLNATHPIFRTIAPDREEIMQVIWWQLAMWIAQHQYKVFEADHFLHHVNQIYLALREQNPERWDD